MEANNRGVESKKEVIKEEPEIFKGQFKVKGSKKIKKAEIKKIKTKNKTAEKDIEKDSLEAKDATYIKRTSIAPRKIRNKI